MPNSVPRLPPIPVEAMSPDQRRAVDAVIRGPRGELSGPFVAMLRSPEFLNRAQSLGEYLRFNSAIPDRLREFATVIVAQHWRQGFEWHIHAPLAEKAGVAAETLESLRQGAPPTAMRQDETAIWIFCDALLQEGVVGDEPYAVALKLLGEAGIVELCGLCGYYAMLAMVMNVARTPLPPGAIDPFRPNDQAGDR
jgi:4-carboxymuconolactone decarboxylase